MVEVNRKIVLNQCLLFTHKSIPTSEIYICVYRAEKTYTDTSQTQINGTKRP